MKSLIRALAVFVPLILSPWSALAAEPEATPWVSETRPYISAMYTYAYGDDDRTNSDTGDGTYLGAGFALDDHWGLELSGFYSEFDGIGSSPPARDFREYGGKVDALFFYSRNPRFSPYFSVGVGGAKTEEYYTSNSETSPFVDAGVGFFKYFVVAGYDVGVRGDLRYRNIFNDNDAFNGTISEDWAEPIAKVGIVLPLGKRPVAPAGPCKDSDGDGVCDENDLCPNTPPGTPVDAKGCPAEKKPADAAAAKKFEDVYFAFDKSDLTDYAKGTLDSAAKTINELVKKYPNLKVDLSGHTDWIGTDGYNQGLSERRANVVKDYLIRKSVPAGRINTYAYGESKPIAPNETDEGRALNRRTEVRSRGE